MNRKELAQAIFKASHLTGEFRLRSGQISNEYFDKYRFESQPRLLSAIAEQMAPLIPPEVEILAGLEMGGIPVATALSLRTGLVTAFVRKKAKEYGTQKIAEGADLRNRVVCIIEDVITTGGQVILSADDLRKEGAIVRDVLCVIQRSNDATSKLAEAGLHLTPLFTATDLKEAGHSS
ncbi:MAG: orotate phosphoribosyltransferase [Bdellovibrionaceae bacterium]|nr:orotate phosphoribosyltransferase [Pseudobdellovibrionaceae bacterium]